MNLMFLCALVAAMILLCGWAGLWLIQLAPAERLFYEYTLIAGMIGIGLGIIWIFYSVFIAYVVVPKADALIDPNQVGDDLIFRHLWAINYGGACTFRWADRRTLNFDCRTLPAEIRYPLMVQFIWLLVVCLLMFGGAALLWAMGEL
ncbi:MAG: hypothetical protein JJU06_15540 [Ectothiorhodospiraceae bacterium]|nr:hypothetical protein [Ectothiorhodospiraceae bacterium]